LSRHNWHRKFGRILIITEAIKLISLCTLQANWVCQSTIWRFCYNESNSSYWLLLVSSQQHLITRVKSITRITLSLLPRFLKRYSNNDTTVLNRIHIRIAIQPDSAIQNRILVGLDFEKTRPDRVWISKPRWSLQSNAQSEEFLRYESDWIKYFDRSTVLGWTGLNNENWIALGLEKSLIRSTQWRNYITHSQSPHSNIAVFILPHEGKAPLFLKLFCF